VNSKHYITGLSLQYFFKCYDNNSHYASAISFRIYYWTLLI